MHEPDEPTLTPASATPQQRFYGQPFWWLLLAVVLVLVPVIGYMVRSDMAWDDIHPAFNALLNGTGMIFLIVGFWAIRRGDVELHKRCMTAAVTASVLFLISYLVRYYLSGTHRYPGTGIDKIIYLVLLFSHMTLAAITLPMVLRTLFLAVRERYEGHKRIARITWPVWLYVSVTGVIVYFMLYHVAPSMYG